AAAGCQRFRSGGLKTFSDRHAASAAALSHYLLFAYLGRRLFRRLLCLPLERSYRRRRVLLVQGTQRVDARQWATLSRDDSLARRHRRRRRDVPRLPRPRSQRRAVADRAWAEAGAVARPSGRALSCLSMYARFRRQRVSSCVPHYVLNLWHLAARRR